MRVYFARERRAYGEWKGKAMSTVWDMPEAEGGGVFRNINRVNCRNVY